MSTSCKSTAVIHLLEDIQARGGLKGSDVANLADVSPATVSRWLKGSTFPHLKLQMKISDYRYVIERLADYYSPQETRLWLYSRHPMLEGERPIDLLHKDETEKVLEVIEQLDAGAFL